MDLVNLAEPTLARLRDFTEKTDIIFRLCNPSVVLLLEAVRRQHCFGLIYRFTCIILINVYNVRMLLITKLSYKISIHKIKRIK